MKNFYISTALIIALTLAGAFSGCTHQPVSNSDNSKFLEILETELGKSDVYDSLKCDRILEIKEQLASAKSTEEKIDCNNRLIHEYESFISDSALSYIMANLRLAEATGDSHESARLRILRADIMSHAGLFTAADRIISHIDTATLPAELSELFYDTRRGIMQYEYEYLGRGDSTLAHAIDSLRHNCIAQVLAIADTTSFIHTINKATQLIDSNEADSAVAYLESKLSRCKTGTRQYAILSSLMAQACRITGNELMRERYLALSAISDIKASVKETTAIRELAEILYERGDYTRANRYLKKSIADATFYSARMRGAQAGVLIPVIDASYDATRRAMSDKLKFYVSVISVLAIILALAVLLILLQLKRLSKSHAKVSQASDELAILYEEVSSANNGLARLNDSLEESNRIKEEYVARFMSYCSVSISALEQYQNSLNVLAQSGDKAALVKKIKSNSFVDNALKEFYQMFDQAFFNIFPTFVDNFNSLLLPQYRIELREGERQLNTELRTFALIRLGITDSSKIAQFLRCSLTTIYTYRSKMRKRAISPDTFEDDVAAIAS